MASTIKKCRVCGKEYEACRSLGLTPGIFRWREVACSLECGAVYLQRINESRGIVNPEASKRSKASDLEPVISETSSENIREEETVIPEEAL